LNTVVLPALPNPVIPSFIAIPLTCWVEIRPNVCPRRFFEKSNYHDGGDISIRNGPRRRIS
jgi:hypothetical protein